MGRRRNKRLERRIARERVDRLFELAEEAAQAGRTDRANRYVELARKVAMRAQTGLPSTHRRRVCNACYAYLHPGTTARVRLRNGVLVTTCTSCCHVNRFPYNRGGMGAQGSSGGEDVEDR